MDEVKLIAHINHLAPYAQMTATEFCPCCLGGMSRNELARVSTELLTTINTLQLERYKLAVTCELSSAFDVSRIAVRTIVSGSTEKQAPFPHFVDLYPRVVETYLKRMQPSLQFTSLEHAEVKLELLAHHGAFCFIHYFIFIYSH